MGLCLCILYDYVWLLNVIEVSCRDGQQAPPLRHVPTQSFGCLSLLEVWCNASLFSTREVHGVSVMVSFVRIALFWSFFHYSTMHHVGLCTTMYYLYFYCISYLRHYCPSNTAADNFFRACSIDKCRTVLHHFFWGGMLWLWLLFSQSAPAIKDCCSWAWIVGSS